MSDQVARSPTRMHSRAVVRIISGLALTALLLGFAWLVRPPAAEPGISYGVPPKIPLAVEKSLGVNADLSHYDPAGREEALEAMEAGGFRWLRHRFPWDAIEREPGTFDWPLWDEIVKAVSKHGLCLIAVLDGSPAWARTAEDAGNPLAPPVQMHDYGAFVKAFAERYGDRVDYYQIWDEPNIAPHWGARFVDPSGYAGLLREAAIQVRAADPDAVVLLAALAPNVEAGGTNMSELLFLDALYRYGARDWFDVVTAQPYPFEDRFYAPPDRERLNWRRIWLLRQVMSTHGDEDTAVWATSFAWPSGTGAETSHIPSQAWSDWPWLGPMLWAAWSRSDLHGEYALLETSGELGSAYDALRQAAARTRVAWPGVYPATHTSATYEGRWRVTPYGADIGASGDRLVIRFVGTRLDLSVRRGDYRAFLFVTVDGQPANALPRDREGRAYVVLYDPLRRVDSVMLARGLTPGEHEAIIVAERGWGQWAIDGWTVVREAPTRANVPASVLALAALVPLAMAFAQVWVQRRAIAARWQALVNRYRALGDRAAISALVAAALLVYVSAGTLSGLLALMLLALVLALRPEMGLPVIALALPFYQPGKPVLGKVFSMVEILTVLTAVLWAGSHLVRWVTGEPGARPTPNGSAATWLRSRLARLTLLDWSVLALVLWSAASVLWAEQGRVAAREFRTVILEAGVFYGLIRATVRNGRDAWRVADGWMLGAGAIAAIGIGQWILGENVITAEGVWRVRGFYGSPNNLALYLGRAFPMALAMAAFSRNSNRRRLYGLALGLIAVALLLTYSRGAWLLGVPVPLLFLIAARGRRTLLPSLGILIVAVVVLLFAVGTGRLASLLNMSEGTTFFRLQLWESSWKMVQDHPLLGVGLDNFLYFYRTRYVLPTAWEEFNLSHPHNIVLDFWLRLGLPGLVLFVGLSIAYFRRSWRAYLKARALQTGESLLLLGLMGGMLNMLAHGLVDAAFFLVDLAFVFMLMAALVQIKVTPLVADSVHQRSSVTTEGLLASG